ncbi:MAG: TonB-linked outer membrane protein SusC/RagA family [Mucilaginibacter sp.]|nr:TonB-linked outer membrane protein SusC/RagA family [Mucilaginibacter sp.]
MRLIAILLFIAFTQVHARGYAQTISIHEKHASIEKVLLLIEKQSSYHFIYDSKLAILKTKKVSLNVDNATITSILDQCLADLPVSYTVIQQTIAIKGNSEIAKERVSAPQLIETPLAIITGKVIDEKGNPLPGVTVLEKGTTNGVVTSALGIFTLKVDGSGSTLVFSFVGYSSQEIKVGNQTIIDVQLKEVASDLNEVVVVGYGTQKKVTLTGAVSSISGAEVATTRNESVLNMLAGKLPGVRVVQNSAEPGAFANSFDIRGMGNPLIIIDGVPRSGIERLDPNDIESVSVLKDASAAVYGVQAANGVILVTTKKGKAGTSQITYSATVGIQHQSGLQSVLDATDYMTLINENTRHNVNNPTTNLIYQPSDFAAFAPGGTKQSTDWYRAVFRQTAPQSEHNLSASGGTDKVTYFMSFGYLTQGGFYLTGADNYHKYNVRSNITAKVARGLNADLQLSYISDTRNEPTTDPQNIFGDVARNPPIYSAYAGDPGNHYSYFGDNGVNALAYSDPNASGYRTQNQKLLQSTFDLTYDIPFISGLSAKALYSSNNTIQDYKTYNKEFDLYQPIINTDGSAGYKIVPEQSPSNVNRSYATYPTTLLQYSLNYNHTFNKVNNVSALALYEEGTSKSDGFNGTKYIAISTLSDLAAGGNVGTFQQTVGGGYPGNTATKSMVSKLHYDFEGKYLVDLSGRRDGSSLFPPSHQYGFFPAASAGWRMSEESFIKHSKALSFIDNLKLRGSYGNTGDASALNYQYVSGYDYPGTGGSQSARPAGSVFDGGFVSDVGFRVLPNPNIFWTKAKMLDFGLDGELWHGLLGFTADYFRRQRDGLLATAINSVPGALGASLPQQNINSDQTSGLELELTHRNAVGKLHYELSGNISYARTENLHVDRAVAGNSYDNWLNNTNNRYNDVWFGYSGNGRFQTFNEIYNAPINYGGGNRGTLPGDYKYSDWNGDGTINLGTTPGESDAHPIAATYNSNTALPPLINFGFTMALQYQNFDLNALFQGAAEKWIAYNDASVTPLQFNGNAFSYFMDRWHPADPNANQFDPHTVYIPGYYAITGVTPNQNSTYNLQNASYVRLKTLEIGYTFPVKWSQKVGIKRARLYVNGYDLFTITGVRNYDPEHPSSNYTNGYPLNKTYNLGVNVTF